MSTPENRLETMLMGFATPRSCLTAHLGMVKDGTQLQDDVRSLFDAILHTMESEHGQRILKAVACSILNLDYMKDGMLHGYDPGDGYAGLHEPDLAKRELMNNAFLVD